MAEVGIDIAQEFPKPWTDEIVRAADGVITMGCGDACPPLPYLGAAICLVGVGVITFAPR